jgi:hypothetical protein
VSAWDYQSEWEQCAFCDHTFRPNTSCEGRPVTCVQCCLNEDGEVVYTPQFLIHEEV